MNKLVDFKNVSKQYRLGLTRTSLPTIISGWATNAFKRDKQRGSKLQYLWALKNISFDLERGQSLALIGPNGAGKTTVLKILANITKQTSGQIEINGRLSALIELGSGFHPDLTGRENIYLNGAILGLKKRDIDRRFDEIVAFSQLEEFIDTPIKRYSSGMSVRLGFSVAASIDPEILLVDEVLAVGDSVFRQKCVDRIRELIEKGTSIVFVSHNIWLVQAVCNVAIYLDHGQVKCIGDTPSVIEAYDRDINEQRAQNLEIPLASQNSRNGEMEITKIEIVGAEGEEKNEFHNNNPVEIKIHYWAHSNMGELNCVIRIMRSDGLTCCMLRTKLDEYRFHVERGEGVVSITLDPVQLYGGSYYVHALIRDIEDIETLYNASSSWFYVRGSILSNESTHGVFEPHRRWNHYRISKPQG